MKSRNGKVILNVVFILIIVRWSKFGNLNSLLEQHGIQALHIINFIFLSVLSYIVIKRKRAQSWFVLLVITLSIPSILFFINNPFSAQFSIIYCVGLIAMSLIFMSWITRTKNSNSI
jgi:hypothetical protein